MRPSRSWAYGWAIWEFLATIWPGPGVGAERQTLFLATYNRRRPQWRRGAAWRARTKPSWSLNVRSAIWRPTPTAGRVADGKLFTPGDGAEASPPGAVRLSEGRVTARRSPSCSGLPAKRVNSRVKVSRSSGVHSVSARSSRQRRARRRGRRRPPRHAGSGGRCARERRLAKSSARRAPAASSLVSCRLIVE